MARQYLVDVYNLAYMEALRTSADGTLAAIADKAVKESRYHLRRSHDWMLRLGMAQTKAASDCSAPWTNCGVTPGCSHRTRWSRAWRMPESVWMRRPCAPPGSRR